MSENWQDKMPDDSLSFGKFGAKFLSAWNKIPFWVKWIVVAGLVRYGIRNADFSNLIKQK
jgi:hypothetical protein